MDRDSPGVKVSTFPVRFKNRHLLERTDAHTDSQPSNFVRATTLEKVCLLTLDIVLAGLLAAIPFNPDIAPVAIYLAIVLVPHHALLFWRLTADMEGLELTTLRMQRRVRWTDVTDLVETSDGGFFLQTRDRALFISRHWSEYGRLLRTIKRHLYVRGWVPLMREYGRRRRVRSLLS